jgi:hypothetical protein
MGKGENSLSAPSNGWSPAKADRRQILGGAAVLGALVGVPAYIWSRARDGEESGATASEKRLLARLSDLVIPATDTPGAVAAGVPAFVELALRHGLEDTAPETSGHVHMAEDRGGLVVLEEVERKLNQLSTSLFLNLTPGRQHDVLAAYDADAFTGERKDHPWKKLKALILTGYYTSEIGGSRELRYELVPGRWDPNLPLAPDNRSSSSDWTAVDFG